jgi:uncharacterized protein
MIKLFLDSNIFLRYLLNDNEEMSAKALSIFRDIGDKKVLAYISCLVLHEVSYVARNVYKIDRGALADRLVGLVTLDNLLVLDLPQEVVIKSLKEYKTFSVDLADIFYKNRALKGGFQIASFDSDMHKIKAPLYSFPSA